MQKPSGLALLLTTALLALSAMASERADAEPNGAALFAANCVACHGPAGKGDGPAAIAFNPKPRNLTDKKVMATVTDRNIADIVRKGGAAVGKSPLMPPFAALTQDQIQALIEFVRNLGKP